MKEGRAGDVTKVRRDSGVVAGEVDQVFRT